jgi:hypothetical protein
MVPAKRPRGGRACPPYLATKAAETLALCGRVESLPILRPIMRGQVAPSRSRPVRCGPGAGFTGQTRGHRAYNSAVASPMRPQAAPHAVATTRPGKGSLVAVPRGAPSGTIGARARKFSGGACVDRTHSHRLSSRVPTDAPGRAVGWLPRQAAAVAPCGLGRGRGRQGDRTAPYRGSERPSYPHAPPHSLPTPPGARFGVGFPRAGPRAGAGNISNCAVFGTVGKRGQHPGTAAPSPPATRSGSSVAFSGAFALTCR